MTVKRTCEHIKYTFYGSTIQVAHPIITTAAICLHSNKLSKLIESVCRLNMLHFQQNY